MKQYSFLNESSLENEVAKQMVKNNISSVAKAAKIALGVGGSGYMLFQGGLNIVLAKRLTELIRILRNPELTREECTKILTEFGYSTDKYGTKKVNPATVKFIISSKIVGPSIQIVNNPDDDQWKLHLIFYLRSARKMMYVKSVGSTAIGGVGLYNFLKHKK